MQESYVLILGAGLMQKTAIEAAKKLGYKTLVTDANPNAVCVPYADVFEPIDLKDKEKLSELALSYGKSLKAVFTAGTDFSASVSYIAEKCRLKSHTFEAATKASNKIEMRRCFKENKIPSPEFISIRSTEIASFIKPGVLDKMKFPKVIKPVDNMGARGCRMIRNKNEFLKSVEDAVSFSRTGNAILEDYMQGNEYSIDALVYNNTLTITGFADRHIFYEPYFIEMGHTMPAVASKKEKKELIEYFAKAVKALGLTCGAAKADIKYTENGPMVGEIAARLSGGYMSGWTYPYASDFNLTEQALLIALGKEPKALLEKRIPVATKKLPFEVYEIPCVKVSAERAYISIPGKISSISDLSKLNAVPFVKNIFPRVTHRENVDFPRNNVEKCGNIITQADSYENAVNFAQKAVSQIVLRLQSDNKQTEEFLAGKEHSAEKLFPPDAYIIPEELKSKTEKFISSATDITEDSIVSELIPDYLKEYSKTAEDYNHRTLECTLKMFDSLKKKHKPIDGKKFWSALFRGGLQAVLYLADCKSSLKKAK